MTGVYTMIFNMEQRANTVDPLRVYIMCMENKSGSNKSIFCTFIIRRLQYC